MPRNPRPSAGERLRTAADRLYALAERWETQQRSLVAVELLHQETEQVAGDVRAVVRGRGFA